MISASASACACRRQPTPQTHAPARRSWLTRTGTASGWALPAVILALLPKCPLCIAAWLAVVGGAGISFAAWSQLRIAIVALCWCILLWMLLRASHLLMRSVQTRRG